jgi:fumarylacetoacetate (FAA) hydrolase family protein
MAFDLELSDIQIPDVCPVLGLPMTIPSLDRRDNDRGYTKDNVEVVHRRTNTLKNDATPLELAKLAVYYARKEVLALLNL